ncbi:bifunctional phosphoribosylaminoimidazolecarboxamide formyltransferase/IMP cyclohydrolase [Tepidimicrobium xylanilyticum]|uniref:Bifunctional purine biosynthesis protein PurH n=1 Tax=Tepidimicrobium xylanilyticum TaxID=1123352 RepID=A0A1H2Q5J6_9FIRM|nr:bifunctional phosphoribosylaminoimidazolecarboxamide formyltransferase/IMP cyclohydrolase [Tepidimicrobium xylanilyticum]GMG95763.1 bifunctional purine biosynthesis protein PurH [Tepidimicrobium xylanilyticum]SDW01699.1 phosphoribosylaminoimidazolecarboxamide formyltransferase / IMP cyclohydrolase [Tepidimicrobium xylanilyticum]
MKRALISVYDKRGVVQLARELVSLGWEIISTGGTGKILRNEDIPFRDIKEITNFPEILDGRVKTLHPHIHGGILYKRDEEEHKRILKKLDIGSIDLVVNNLYPFEDTIKKEGISHEEVIENIDIGGPAMIRAAAKNYKYITVVIDPSDYGRVLKELRTRGETSLDLRRELARKVFQYTAYYDSLIANYFNCLNNVEFPDIITIPFKDKQELRYGENPHQKAAFYKEYNNLDGTIAAAIQLHGKELSFNNINDGNGALEILKEFDEPTVVAVKHANPCGIGSGKDLLEAYVKAYECDKISIFGGIIAVNRIVDEEVAKRINEIFIEIVMAPDYTQKALEVLATKKNIRILKVPNIMKNDYASYDIKKVLGGVLIQQRNRDLLGQELKVVTKRKPTEKEMEDLIFGWKAVKGVKSNGVLLAKDKATIGIGGGEVNRVWAVKAAIERAGDKAKGSVLASDGFFPFKDSVEALAKAGVTAIIQPGGSLRDQESIEEADKNGMVMIFTGMRHFKH